MHPLTWWLASIFGAVSIVRSNSAVVAMLMVAIAAVLVKRFSQNAPWANGFWFSLKLGLWILLIRLLAGILIGTPDFGKVLFTLPQLLLPDWMAGIRIGGAVSQERLQSSLHEGIIIVAIIAMFGAATSLTSPHKLLRVIPVSIYEVSVALVIAASILPQLVVSFQRIRSAQSMRGGASPRVDRVLIPLLEECLSRSVELAAAMDSRGYGSSPLRSKYKKITWSSKDLMVLSMAFCAVFLIPVVTP